MNEKDYYEILEVSKNASQEVIKTAYKSLLKKYHPDSTGNMEDDKKIIEINEAYEVLNNPQKKKEYDESLEMENELSMHYESNKTTIKKNRKWVCWIVLIVGMLLGINNIPFRTNVQENVEYVEVLISVQRIGNLLTNIGDLEVWIDEEKVFEVDGNSTNSVVITMPAGEHTIQVKGQGDKSKKRKFEVSRDDENEFYFSAEISNWFGVKLEERTYIPEK